MFLIAGLGNPGFKYKYTKHNFGFLLADKIIDHYQLKPIKVKSNQEAFSGKINDKKVLLIKPQDYMNNSGLEVGVISRFYKIPPKNVIILHDDLDLELGKIKAKIGGGNAGHNGLKDVDQRIGKNYTRIRLGIGRPDNENYEISDYVLSKFDEKELEIVENVNDKICKILPIILDEEDEGYIKKLDDFMNQFAIA